MKSRIPPLSFAVLAFVTLGLTIADMPPRLGALIMVTGVLLLMISALWAYRRLKL